MSQKTKIVVVEDEIVLRELIVDELLKNNFEVVEAKDGEIGINLIRQELPDLILLDLLMPNKNGYDVLSEMLVDDKLKNIPCIVISNSGQSDDLNRAFSLGAKSVLIKAEFNPDQVVMKVKQALGLE